MVKPDNSQPVALAGSLRAVAANEPMAGDANQSRSSVGELLRLAREKTGLSPGDVAARLRMGLKQVRALEEDDYSALPKGTFLRGFVRNYAKVVGIKPEQALALLEQTHQAAVAIKASAVVMPSQQNISVPTPGGEIAKPRARVFAAAVFVGVLFIVVWWWWENVRPYRAEGGRPKSIAEETAVSVPIAVPESAFSGVTSGAFVAQGNNAVLPALSQTEPPRSASNPVSPTVPAEATFATPLLAEIASATGAGLRVGNNGVLGLTFSDKSWVQVVDATGTTVLDRVFRSGEAEELTGRAPFVVVIGNAQATRLAYNGKEIDLAPHTSSAVARLTVK